ncbi:MAG: CTP synthase, partial [Chitinophagaceae bacterium]
IGLEKANSTEMDPETPNPVIDLMEDQKTITQKGGTMRLGSYPCDISKGTKAHAVYGKNRINERHRHRYEFNNAYLKKYEKAGMIASGINPETGLVEIVEIPEHIWFVAAQFHPELKSTVENPHPLFVKFVKAASQYHKSKV